MKSNWKKVKLKELCDIRTGRKDANEGSPEGKYPFFTCAKDHIWSETYTYDQEAILIAGNGEIGETKLYKGKFEAYQRTYIVTLSKNSQVNTSIEYLFLFINGTIKSYLKTRDYGSTIKYIRKSALEDFEIPLPPLSEQKQIVEKLNEANAKLETAEKALQESEKNIRYYQSSFLSQQIKSHQASIMKVGDLLTDIRYGTSKKSTYEGDGVGILRIPNVAKGFIDDADIKYSKLTDKEIEKLRLEVGDILVIRSNGSPNLVGRSAMIREGDTKYSYAGYLIRLRLDKTKVDPYFFNLVFNSDLTRRQIEKTSRSTNGINNINSDEIRSLDIELPDLDAQKEITKKMKLLNTKQKSLKANVEEAKSNCEKIRQSILNKAFQGELINNL